MAVLDLDREALAAESERLAAQAAAGSAALAVELIDRATWLAMRRLQESGMLQVMEYAGRILHRAEGFAETEGRADSPAPAPDREQAARTAELRGQAERSLRIARVLADGGFAEEAPPLIAKAIGHGAAARLSALGELSEGVALATPAQIRALVERGVLSPQALDALVDRCSAAPAPCAAEIGALLDATAHVLAACGAGLERAAAPGR
ncbi:MAG TPA: hypothetical protein VIY51_20445 [Xanthobacteraceae bacterium]